MGALLKDVRDELGITPRPFSQDEIPDQFIVRAKDFDEPVALRFLNLRKLFLYKVKNLTHFLNATNESP